MSYEFHRSHRRRHSPGPRRLNLIVPLTLLIESACFIRSTVPCDGFVCDAFVSSRLRGCDDSIKCYGSVFIRVQLRWMRCLSVFFSVSLCLCGSTAMVRWIREIREIRVRKNRAQVGGAYGSSPSLRRRSRRRSPFLGAPAPRGRGVGMESRCIFLSSISSGVGLGVWST